ncbi:MAG TPA: DUF1269 domain-containing protein [Marmoricola sp.]
MLTLTVWIFDTVDAAACAAAPLNELGRQRGHGLLETAVVMWGAEDRQPDVEMYGDARDDPLERPFWAVVLGLIFSLPLLGAALAHPAAGSTAAMIDVGLSETFMNRVRDEVVPGTSALFALLSAEELPLLQSRLAGQRCQELTTEITGVHETAVRELFCS